MTDQNAISGPASSGTACVVGNGPSLARADRRVLDVLPWVGMNAAYREWEKNGRYPTYYTCLDLIVGASHAGAIGELIDRAEELGIHGFLLRENIRDRISASRHMDRVQFFETLPKNHPVAGVQPVTTGSHAALWMASLGYRQLVLMGIDANYVEMVPSATKGKGLELRIEKDAPNPNYYFDGYQQLGDQYSIPNPRPGTHAFAWYRVWQKSQRGEFNVLNSSEGSSLFLFPAVRIRFDEGTGSAILQPASPIEAGAYRFEGQSLADMMARILPAHYGRIWGGTTAQRHEYATRGFVSFSSLPRANEDIRWDIVIARSELPEEALRGGALLLSSVLAHEAGLLEKLLPAADTTLAIRKEKNGWSASPAIDANEQGADYFLILREHYVPPPGGSMLDWPRSPVSAIRRRVRSLRTRIIRRVRRRLGILVE